MNRSPQLLLAETPSEFREPDSDGELQWLVLVGIVKLCDLVERERHVDLVDD